MDPALFVDRWRANTRPEAAAAKAHFMDLCDLLRVPKPQEDSTGGGYAFEKAVAKADGRAGYADVWKRECFGWEYKSRGGDLDGAHDQLLRYAGALGNPPLLVTSDMDRIIVRTAWQGFVSERHDFGLSDLLLPDKRARLREMWTPPPLAWRPPLSEEALTEDAAGRFADLASRLHMRGHDPAEVAHFVVRLAFCFFAHDAGLLPRDVLPKLLAAGRREPARFAEDAGVLFDAMRTGGRIGFDHIPWFNGGLFDDARALPLAASDAAALSAMVDLRWRDLDPAIMGTLFERGLDPGKRGQLGAHYTDRATIGRIMDPVVRRPLAAEWARARERIAALMEERRALRAEAAATGRAEVADLAATSGGAVAAKRRALAREADRKRRAAEARVVEAEAIFEGHLARLRDFRVLDAACGSGNFLYVALLTLKDLEGVAIAEAVGLGLAARFPEVGPEAVLGIEVNPYAAELARLSVWVGHIQWARRNGYPPPEEPVLRSLDTVANRDAILAEDAEGRPVPATWPRADAIVGNPPFIGGKMLRRQLGDAKVDRLFAAYAGRVPAEADFVCYWFDKAREAVAEGGTARVGLVTTNSIRGGANREVLDRFMRAVPVVEAWSDEPWTLDGAAVRVSIVCADQDAGDGPRLLDGREVPAIFADLSAGATDLTRAARLPANAGVCFMGTTKVGPFDVSGEVARTWLSEPPNANGRPNADVVRPWRNGLHILRRADDAWVVDFGATMGEGEAAFYALPFAHVALTVKPTRDGQRRDGYREAWWRHGEARSGMRRALTGLARFIVTPRVAKHRLFAWLPTAVVPDCQLIVFARDDDTTFGILHSRWHETWAIRMGSWMGAGNDPRYTPTTTFETFPFPGGLTPDLPAASYADDPRAQRIAEAARKLVAARDRWLNPEDMVERVREVVPGFPDRIVPRSPSAAVALRKRTLTALYNARGTPEGAWLDALHRDLDAAVAAAYGWPADLPTDDALARLLALNAERAPGGALPPPAPAGAEDAEA